MIAEFPGFHCIRLLARWFCRGVQCRLASPGEIVEVLNDDTEVTANGPSARWISDSQVGAVALWFWSIRNANQLNGRAGKPMCRR